MKRNILKGMILIGAIALSSCSTQNKIAAVKSDAAADDDVYFTKAKAGDQPVYAARTNDFRQDSGDDYMNNQADYYYYGSYADRLNRFYNYSPFMSTYYDGLYGSPYSPYYSGFNVGVGFGLGYGYYDGYNPYGYYGYNPYWGYSNYGYYGSTIGYGYAPYWGRYSYYSAGRTYNNPRPYRGSGMPAIAGSYGSGRGTVSYGSGVNPYPTTSNRRNTSSGSSYNGNNNGYARPTRNVDPAPQRQTQSQPASQPQSAPQSYGGGGGSSSGGGGGGGRPVRP